MTMFFPPHNQIRGDLAEGFTGRVGGNNGAGDLSVGAFVWLLHLCGNAKRKRHGAQRKNNNSCDSSVSPYLFASRLALHRMILVARMLTSGGIVKPITCRGFQIDNKLKLRRLFTGRSVALVPFRILST